MLTLPSVLSEIVLFILGITIGSFLNVVIYRLPIMLKHKWHNDCATLLEIKCTTSPVNLCYPSSHCPKCMAKVPLWSNIPLVGFLLLGGKCFSCKDKISIRYPFIELVAGILFGIAGYLFSGALLLVLLLYISFVLCLIFIDYDNFILPDELTLPLLWLGILFNIHGMIAGSLENSVIGTMVGYLLLWSIFWIFKLITKRDGMGYGDFKFLAAILAWVGYQGVVPITMVASILGIAYFSIALILGKTLGHAKLHNTLQQHIPFGPFLGSASMIFIFAPKIFVSQLWL
jgi:leader peptidase (prepilin peptidase)/N-methyltransferase